MTDFGILFNSSSEEESDYSSSRVPKEIKMAPPSPNRNSEPLTSQINAVSVKLPPFWIRSPRIWFTKVECQFALQNVSTESTKFAHVMSVLNEEVAEKVMDVIENPGDTPYTSLKQALIEQYTISEERRVQELLAETDMGDRKPSDFYKHMRSMAGNSEKFPDELLTSLWESRLPSQISAILKCGNFTDNKVRLTTADRVFDALKNVQVHSMQSAVSTSMQSTSDMYEKLLMRNRDLEAEINELRVRFNKMNKSGSSRDASRNRGRSQSRNRNFRNSDFCYYHNRFGEKALKCREPCKFKTGN